ncbi:MAG: DUF3516 domain-containing protein [Polyangiaceae bacterium]|nr:DUF3516 domain-containing protein [Polyangiaceae bacterium]
MAEPKLAPLEPRLPEPGAELDGDQLLDAFLDYSLEIGLELYPAQEEGILEIFADHHLVLSTPTGSGKSLVALAACFRALAMGQRAFYTAPIKALVSEKFFELCEALGPQNVGLMTGDATVNREAPIICCTAEILSNMALRKGEHADVDWVVMDEFHYYADRDRGVAWQIPLLTLPRTRFVLMSATLGNTEFFVKDLKMRTGVEAALVSSDQRPVPLDFGYCETPILETIESLVSQGRCPVYIVHFSQRAASEAAQDLMSTNLLSKPEKQLLRDELADFRFDSAFGKELKRFIPHGVGVHHAGMLPKYRRLVERLSRKGLLRVICGTDTLGVGVNVPIRTVLFTQLCKFDGERSRIVSVREFHQIAGRAGRKGFDERGSVLVQAPAHVIENLGIAAKIAANPKKKKKLRLKKEPERGYVAWNAETLTALRDGTPETLTSQFKINHGMLLSVLSRSGGACGDAKQLVRQSHESAQNKRRLMRHGMALFRSLVEADIVCLTAGGAALSEELQQDFSLNQALGLFAVEALASLDETATDYAGVLISVMESILENPGVVLMRQVNVLRTRCLAELKAEGVEYNERLAELDKVEYPKPEAEFIYDAFNLFAKNQPWVAGFNIAPKSIVREMFELGASFRDYVNEYGLARAEGVLLRYLTDAYRTLRQTVPDKFKTEDVLEIEDWLGAELRSIDASLIDEWEALQCSESDSESTAPAQQAERPHDITHNRRAFRVTVRNAAWRIVRALAIQNYDAASEALLAWCEDDTICASDGQGKLWTSQRFAESLTPYWTEYDALLTNADARGPSRVSIDETEDIWTLRQSLSDPEDHLEWSFTFQIDLKASRDANRVMLTLTSLGSTG